VTAVQAVLVTAVRVSASLLLRSGSPLWLSAHVAPPLMMTRPSWRGDLPSAEGRPKEEDGGGGGGAR
jgi:hypothetical protein